MYASAKIWAPWNLKMEKGSCIGPEAVIYNQAKVTLEENVCVSQYAYICTAGHNMVSSFRLQASSSKVPLNNAESGLVFVLSSLLVWIRVRPFLKWALWPSSLVLLWWLTHS